jgi:hypothetical protein
MVTFHDASSTNAWQDQAAASKFSRWHKAGYQAQVTVKIPYESTLLHSY